MNLIKKLLCLASCFVPLCCSDATSVVKEESTPYTVSLKLNGDYDLNVDQDPLTKASSNDAYGINVYYDRESNGKTDDVYAYGLFDNVPAMSITLLSGHKYKFTCCLIKNAMDTLYYGQAFGNAYSGYAYPFQTSSSGSTQVGNRFIINENNVYLSGLGSGPVHLKSTTSPSTSNTKNYARINRYYGETDQYVPVANGTVNIYLKRVVFGAKFVVTGVKEGKARVKCGDWFDLTLDRIDTQGIERIYSFADPYSCWKYEEDNAEGIYSSSFNLSVDYTSYRGGTLWNLSKSQSVTFKRNVMTTVYINLSPDLSGATFTMAEEPLGDDNEINIGIDGNTLIDITVNPND